MVILVTSALSFTTSHTTWGPKNKWINVLAILIHLEHYLNLVLNGQQTFLGSQWGVVWKSEDSMADYLRFFF